MAANPREELIAYLAKMSDQEVGKLLKFAQGLHQEETSEQPDSETEYRRPAEYEHDDPIVGMFSESKSPTTTSEDSEYKRPPEYDQYDPTVGMVSGVIDGARRIHDIVEEAIIEKFASRGKPLKKD